MCQVYMLETGLEAKRDEYVQFSLCGIFSYIEDVVCKVYFQKADLEAKQLWTYAILSVCLWAQMWDIFRDTINCPEKAMKISQFRGE